MGIIASDELAASMITVEEKAAGEICTDPYYFSCAAYPCTLNLEVAIS
jgi:hypothetical protein